MRRIVAATTGAAACLVGVLGGCSQGSEAPPAVAHTSGSTHPTGTPSRQPPPARLHVLRAPWRLPGPIAREAVVLETASSAVVAGGLLPRDRSSASTYTLDLRDGSVRQLPDLVVPVHDTAATRVGGQVLVIGGGGTSEQSGVQADAAGRWRVVGNLPSARSDLVALRVGRRTFVVGGYDGTSIALPDVLSSLDGRHWRVAARLPVPVRYAATVVANGSVWVFGGERAGAMVDVVQRIDPRTGVARVVAHLPVPLGHAVAVRLGDRLLVAGGRTSADTVTRRMWWYRPGHGFRPAGRLPSPLSDSAVVSPDSRTAYLVGGETPGFSDRVVRLSLD